MEKMINVDITCKQCNKIVQIKMTEDQKNRLDLCYTNNEKIQDILPYGQYTPAEREMFISGICGECWNVIFPPEDEDDLSPESLDHDQ